jgi:hypothetical protein
MPEPKTIRYWIERGFQFLDLSNCEACGRPVEVWTKNNQMVPLNGDTLETHFSTCARAKEYRTELRLKEGVL